MKEQWKDIENTDGYYQISNHGRVRSWKNGKWGKRKEPKVLKLGYCRRGYKRQSLNHKGNKWNISIHREVANAFIPNPDNKEQVNHIDGNKENNHVSNLEWNTQSENMLHGNSIGLFNHKSGQDRHNSNLTNKQVRTIRFQYRVQDITHRELSEAYNVSQSCITALLNGRTYQSTHIV